MRHFRLTSFASISLEALGFSLGFVASACSGGAPDGITLGTQRQALVQTQIAVSFQNGINDYAGTADTSLASGFHRRRDFGDARYLFIEEDHSHHSHGKSAVISWDVSSIPVGSTIQEAAITLDVINPSHHTYEVQALKRSWSEARATWWRATTDERWQSPGADGSEDRDSTILATLAARSRGFATIPLNADGIAKVQEWVNKPAANYGLVLSDEEERRAKHGARAWGDDLRVASSEYEVAQSRPKLAIKYLPPPPPPDPDVLIARGSIWSYRDDGGDQGAGWTSIGFDDSGWLSGPAELGYGDDDEATVVSPNSDSTNRPVTTYFRHKFHLNYPEHIAALKLGVVRDDGAIVYLNGVEVYRSNMPTGDVLASTLASSHIGGTGEQAPQVIVLQAPPVVDGANVIAVEIHQGPLNNNDLSFDLMLRKDNTIIPKGATWSYLDDGSDQGTAWTALGYDDATWRSGRAELGYGEGDEATVVGYGPSTTKRFITTYFRHKFDLTNLTSIPSLTMGVLRDDGAVVYLNGVEVFRSNMPAGQPLFNTLASSQIYGSDEQAFQAINLNSNLLISGTNVIAAEIHQNAANSSDLGFDLEMLKGDPRPAPLPPPTADDTLFLAAGDIGTCKTTGDTETALLLDENQGPIAVLGDSAQVDGSPSDYAECFDPVWGRHKPRIHPAPGNHDYIASTDALGYFEYYGAAAGTPGQGYYSYDVGNWHIVALNSNCSLVGCDAASAQVQWLEQDLTAHPQECTLAYFHHPRYSSGLHGNNTTMADVWQVLMNHGVDVVLSGHDHGYQRWRTMGTHNDYNPSGIAQFVVGTGGMTLQPFTIPDPGNSVFRTTSTHGILRMRLRSNEYAWEFLPIGGGAALDWGTARCH